MKRRWIDLGSYYQGLTVVGIAYILIFGWMIIAGHGVPYVMDNNETFSVWWHSYNLFKFDFWKSFGLTDEAFSFDPDAHPVVHPHQGNWPRIFGFLMFVLGARSVEAQTILTALTIGMFSVFLAYYFFYKTINTAFSTILCLVLMSDYVLYAQWHIGTYRVWHLFFVFSTLVCALWWGDAKRRWQVALFTAVNYIGLFYWELVFAAFIAAFAGCYSIYLYYRKPRLLCKAVLCQLAGAAAGLALVVTQLVAYYGVAGMKQDFYFTFLARNHVGTLQQLMAEMREFYDKNNVAFWYNFGDNTEYLHVIAYIRSFFSYDLQIHTPIFTAIALVTAAPLFIVGARRAGAAGADRPSWSGGAAAAVLAVLAAGLAIGAVYEYRRGAFGIGAVLGGLGGLSAIPMFRRILSETLDTPSRRVPLMIASGLPDAALCLGFTAYLLAVSSPFMVAALPPRDRWFHDRHYIAALLGGLLLTAFAKWLAGVGIVVTEAGRRTRVLGAAFLLIALAAFLRYQSGLYDQDFAPLWQRLQALNYGEPLFQGMLVAGGLLTATVVMMPDLIAWHRLRELRAYILCGLIGYSFTYILSAGYVYSGYLVRSTPFTVFLTDIVVAAAIYCSFVAAREGYSSIRGQGFFARSLARICLPGCLSLLVVVSWGWQQLNYVRMLPPDSLNFMSRLESGPYRDSSFIVNNYAAPVAEYTRKWAYYADQVQYWAQRESQQADPTQVDVATITEANRELPYLWMADRRINGAYLYPQYYLCFVNQTMAGLLNGLRANAGATVGGGCDMMVNSIQKLAQKRPALLPTVVDFDREGIARRGWQSWAIVKLDWDFPPFVRATEETTRDRPVRAIVTSSNNIVQLRYDYAFAQRDGVAEQGTSVELLRVGETAVCGDGDAALTRMGDAGPGARGAFDLPAGFVGKVAVRVIPRTAIKAGRPYYSAVLSLPGGGRDPLACPTEGLLAGEPTPDQLGLPYYRSGRTINFGLPEWELPILGKGWSDAEELGRWSVNENSGFFLNLQNPAAKSLHLTAKVLPFIVPAHPRQAVTVLANGKVVADWVFEQAGWTTVTADIPAAAIAGSTRLDIELISTNVVSPFSTQTSADKRRLKLLIQTAVISDNPR